MENLKKKLINIEYFKDLLKRNETLTFIVKDMRLINKFDKNLL